MSDDEKNASQQASSNHSIRAILGLEESGEAIQNNIIKNQAEILDDDGENLSA